MLCHWLEVLGECECECRVIGCRCWGSVSVVSLVVGVGGV